MKKFKTHGEALGYVLDKYIAELTNPDYVIIGLPYYGMSVKLKHHDCDRLISFRHIDDDVYSYELVSDVWGKDHDQSVKAHSDRLDEWRKVKEYVRYIEPDEKYNK